MSVHSLSIEHLTGEGRRGRPRKANSRERVAQSQPHKWIFHGFLRSGWPQEKVCIVKALSGSCAMRHAARLLRNGESVFRTGKWKKEPVSGCSFTFISCC